MIPKKLLTKSALSKDIFLYTLGNPSGPAMVLVGGMHGDEPEGSTLVEDFLKESETLRDSFKIQVLAIPRYNPDGLDKDERTNGNGVDLNRNFPSQDWSAHVKAPRYNPGSEPSSESETRALVELLQNTRPFLVVHCHTYVPQVCYTGKKSEPFAQRLSKTFGHPVTEDIGYPTPGSLGQYCLLNLDTACVCVELPEKVDAATAWKMVGPSLLEIALHGP